MKTRSLLAYADLLDVYITDAGVGLVLVQPEDHGTLPRVCRKEINAVL